MRQIDFGFTAADQRDFRSQSCKTEREPLADPASGAGNQNVFLFEFLLKFPLKFPLKFHVRRCHAGSDLRVEQVAEAFPQYGG
jgi:hypothetical protein